VPVLWTEVRLVRERRNRELANEVTLIRLGVASVISAKAGAEFTKRVKRLVES